MSEFMLETFGVALLVFVIGFAVFIVFVIFILLYLRQIRNLTEDTRQLVGRGVKIDPDAEQYFDLAVDLWRLRNHIAAIDEKLDNHEKKRLDNTIRRLDRFLAKNDFEVFDYIGRPYNDGMNIEILDEEQDAEVAAPKIFETVEPEVRHKGIIRRRSKVIVHSPLKEKPVEPAAEEIVPDVPSSDRKEDAVEAEAEAEAEESINNEPIIEKGAIEDERQAE